MRERRIFWASVLFFIVFLVSGALYYAPLEPELFVDVEYPAEYSDALEYWKSQPSAAQAPRNPSWAMTSPAGEDFLQADLRERLDRVAIGYRYNTLVFYGVEPNGSSVMHKVEVKPEPVHGVLLYDFLYYADGLNYASETEVLLLQYTLMDSTSYTLMITFAGLLIAFVFWVVLRVRFYTRH